MRVGGTRKKDTNEGGIQTGIQMGIRFRDTNRGTKVVPPGFGQKVYKTGYKVGKRKKLITITILIKRVRAQRDEAQGKVVLILRQFSYTVRAPFPDQK